MLGTGPSGLAAGYTLAKAGLKPVLLERDKVYGGLMRSLRRGDFVVDVGRKELYNRLEKVDDVWTQLLASDYRSYAHRGGILYDGHIIEMSPGYRGARRGMPWKMLAECAAGFLAAQLRQPASPPLNVEEYFYRKRGRRMTQVLAQGFQEKLTGRRWSEMRLKDDGPTEATTENGSWGVLKALVRRSISNKEVNTFRGIWRHPARGTGQICDAFATSIVDAGGRFEFGVNLRDIATAGGRIDSVTADTGSGQVTYRPEHLVSSIPLDGLLRFIAPGALASTTGPVEPVKRTVVLVYLFLDESPRFPQAWLQVTDPSTRIGRITNYTAFNGDMVPAGKTCLCCEYYCFGADDPLLALTDDELVQRTLGDCARFKLLDASRRFDQLVMKFPGADASQNRHNWLSRARMQAVESLRQFANLYYVNRTDLDIATLAGVEAAEAIISGDRALFDRHTDPTNLPIRSNPKPFEFKLPSTV